MIVAAYAVFAYFLGMFTYRLWWRKLTHQYGERGIVLHGVHSHECDCGATWTHNDEEMPMGKIHEWHTCVICHKPQFTIANHEELHEQRV